MPKPLLTSPANNASHPLELVGPRIQAVHSEKWSTLTQIETHNFPDYKWATARSKT